MLSIRDLADKKGVAEIRWTSTRCSALARRVALWLLVCLAGPGCVVFRYADFVMPGVRLDRPSNAALPSASDPTVEEALEAFASMTASERRKYPTPYHVYVDAPAPGTFEGEHIVGLAFAGGGTRGTVFEAMCVKAIEALGDVVVEGPEGVRRVSILDEVDYVSGVSTGSIPAAAFVLNRGETCPDALELGNWPDCFNVNLAAYALGHLAVRPDRIARDLTLGMNTRPALAGAIAGAFFEGSPNRLASGLTFGDLPPLPVLFLGVTVVNDPAAPFIQTRFAYRYAIDTYPEIPWGVGVQSFESFHSDPMAYPLGEACYNSSSFPGNMRSGLMVVRPDRAWVFEGLGSDGRERMARSRLQTGYEGTYEVKDGGLIDNRGIASIDRLFHSLSVRGDWRSRPLLLALDAGYRELRPAKKGGKVFKKGWFEEVYASSRASWQTGQDAYERLFNAHAADKAYALVRLRFTAWVRYMPRDGAPSGPETEHLVTLCRASPHIQTPMRLLDVLRGIGTTLSDLSVEEMDGVRIAAHFGVWLEQDKLLEWASQVHDGAPARFAGDEAEKY